MSAEIIIAGGLNLITRTFRLEQAVALLDERVRVANHRISDLEKEEVE